MARLSQLIGAGLLALFGACAHAGYAQLAPPERFGGAYPNFTFAPSANDSRYGKVAFQPNGLKVPVPGSPVTMPAAYKFAANAPRFAAAVVLANPALRTAIGIATWLGLAGLVWDEVNKVWKKNSIDPGSGTTVSDGYLYFVSGYESFTTSSTPDGACKKWVDLYNPAAEGPDYYSTFSGINSNNQCVRTLVYTKNSYYNQNSTANLVKKDNSSCPAGWYVTPAGCVQTPPPQDVNQEQLKEELANKPMPDTVPWELPFPTPLPVEQPIINPEPGTNPQPRPKFVPTGDPVANPNYDPNAAPSPQNQPYIQPGIRVQPSPTPQEPWRVDVQPVNRPTPTTNPGPDPDPTTEPGDGDQPKPEEQQSLCEKHPDILACQKLDQPEAKELAKEDINISITPVSGWGAENAACPAPRAVQVAGRAVEISWQPVCDFASGLRPLVIALAWLSAVSMVIVVARRN